MLGGLFSCDTEALTQVDGHIRQEGCTEGRRLSTRATKDLAATSATRGFSWLGEPLGHPGAPGRALPT